jgi:GA-binding protein transcription factor, beta
MFKNYFSIQLGTSPLHLAAKNNHTETCRFLLRSSISKDSKNKVDRSPLHVAAYEGHDNIVAMLLKAKVEVDPRDMVGNCTDVILSEC